MSTSKYPTEIKINPNKGGKAAIERLVEAYGFTTRQALADHLEVSKSTLANRYMRDTFPADWIIQCALETGISLCWLTTGQGLKQSSQTTNTIELKRFRINAGKMVEDGSCIFDSSFLPASLTSPITVLSDSATYVCDKNFVEVLDGLWLVNIDGTYSMRTIIRLPKGMIKVSSLNDSFECNFSDIDIIAKVRLTISSIPNEN